MLTDLSTTDNYKPKSSVTGDLADSGNQLLKDTADAATTRLTQDAKATVADARAPMKLQLAFAIPQHMEITDDALYPLNLGNTSRAEIKGGNRSQDLSPSTRNLPTHHFDDNELSQSLAYVNQTKRDIEHALAGPYTQSEAPQLLDSFGHELHTLQDFYAHSNYVETELKANPHMKPQDLPLMNWHNIPDGKAKNIHTGFTIPDETLQFFLQRNDVINSLNQYGMRIPGTRYLPSTAYEQLNSFNDRLNYFTNQHYSVLHRDLNKDDSLSDEGKVVNPYTGYNLYDYAKNLAVRETARQWKELESTVHKLHGKQDGDAILQDLKTIQIYRPDIRD